MIKLQTSINTADFISSLHTHTHSQDLSQEVLDLAALLPSILSAIILRFGLLRLSDLGTHILDDCLHIETRLYKMQSLRTPTNGAARYTSTSEMSREELVEYCEKRYGVTPLDVPGLEPTDRVCVKLEEVVMMLTTKLSKQASGHTSALLLPHLYLLPFSVLTTTLHLYSCIGVSRAVAIT